MGRADNLTTFLCQLSRYFGSLNLLERPKGLYRYSFTLTDMGPILQNIFAKSVQEVSVCFKIKYVERREQVSIRVSSTYYTNSHTSLSAEPDGTIRHFHSCFPKIPFDVSSGVS